VVVCSDHGYTEIHRDAPVVRIDDGGKVKTRSAWLADDAPDLPETWRLKRELAGLHRDTGVARGYACFGSRPRGATHGGCTPQEMAVPWLVLDKSRPVSLKALSLYVEGSVHRRRRENEVLLCLSNPNKFTVKVTEVAGPGFFRLREAPPLEIPPESARKVPCDIDGSGVFAGSLRIDGTYTLERMGESRKIPFDLRMETAGAMTTDFDDEFDL